MSEPTEIRREVVIAIAGAEVATEKQVLTAAGWEKEDEDDEVEGGSDAS